MGPRQEPLRTRTPLKRRTELGRGSAPEGGGTLKRAAPLKPGRSANDPDELTRQAVLDRDGWRCVCCGQSVIGRPHSIGHRKRRSQGGRLDTSNLVTFLGYGTNPGDPYDHHRRVDSRVNPDDEDRGLSLRSWQDPADVPVVVAVPGGGRVLYWLTDDGERVPYDPCQMGGAA